MARFSLIALRILDNKDEKSEKINKVLKPGWYLFNQSYKLEKDELVINTDYPLSDDFFGKNISINAIVGKNGGGKSSIIDLVLRIINNFAEQVLKGRERPAASELYYVDNVNAELYFELNNKLCYLKCKDKDIQYDFGDGKKNAQPFKNLKEMQKFFYSIVVNYSLHAYNENDYLDEGLWIRGLFDKNDGYLTPIVITPYRNESGINSNKEQYLTNNRLIALLLYYKEKQKTDFIENYILQQITYTLDHRKTNQKSGHNSYFVVSFVKPKSIFEAYINAYKLPTPTNSNSELRLDAYNYLVRKTNQISQNYPSYKKYYKIDKYEISTLENLYNEETKKSIEELVDYIKKDKSHVTLKIRQTLHFLTLLDKNENEEKFKEPFDYKNYADYSKSSSLDSIMETLPPPLFKAEIRFNNGIPLSKMSSGERQFLFAMSTVLYHIKNLMSIPEGDDERVKYKNINIILDEIELFFHPEYQRTFIKNLIDYLVRLKMNEEQKINIIFATHSPFILSDIPNCNIIYLDKGKQKKNVCAEPFGANIHDILKHDFFLNNGFMGDFAKEKIKHILDEINSIIEKNKNIKEAKDKHYLEKDKYDEFVKTMKLIGEPLIKNKLMSMINDVYSNKNDIIDNRIKMLEKEIKDLKESKEE
ncbi:MAG: AAA family ATPase [Fibrobacter sp.]|jgi:predicted ATP-binding protein involved in virulence|nr:AAA family ATPase [Fibrobacter sp.]